MDVRFFSYESPLGSIYIAYTEMGVCLLGLCKSLNKFVEELRRRRLNPVEGEPPSKLVEELDAYFSGKPMRFSFPTHPLWGTEFQKDVWSAMKEIPYGETRTYGWLAERVERPRAFRAVGNAVAKNPIPIIIPCHRVVRADGSIGGFSCGVELKRWLLKHEGAIR